MMASTSISEEMHRVACTHFGGPEFQGSCNHACNYIMRLVKYRRHRHYLTTRCKNCHIRASGNPASLENMLLMCKPVAPGTISLNIQFVLLFLHTATANAIVQKLSYKRVYSKLGMCDLEWHYKISGQKLKKYIYCSAF